MRKIKVCCPPPSILFLDLCCNRLVPLNDSKDHKLSDKLRHLVRHLVPSGLTYSPSGKLSSRTRLIPEMIVILIGDLLCTAVEKDVFIRELKETKRGDSERMEYILKQKDLLKARKRVSSPLNSFSHPLILSPLLACSSVFFMETRSGQETEK